MLRFRPYRLKCNALDYQECEDSAWKVYAPYFEDYTKSFENVKGNILRGNSYLANKS